MGGTKRLRRSATAPEVPGWAQAGALQGGAGCATCQSWRPGRDPGKALVPDWRPPRGRSVGEPVAPEARDAPRAAVTRQPRCASRVQFDRCVPGRSPKATAGRTARPKEKKGMGWGRGSGARKRCHLHQLGSFLTQPLICHRCLIPVIYICL